MAQVSRREIFCGLGAAAGGVLAGAGAAHSAPEHEGTVRATLVKQEMGGYYWTMQLATGESVRMRRGQIPLRGMLHVGDELDVDFITLKLRKVVRAQKR